MGVTWNQQLVKKENKTLVLKLIKNHSPISRADTAQKLGLNKGTVSSLVAELLDEQLITESGPGESSGGRRPVMLLFNQNAGYTIGVDLGVNYILAVLTDLQGNIICQKNEKNESHSFEDTFKLLKTIISSLIKKAPTSPYGVVGIGIGAPGIINMNGDVVLAPNLQWRNLSLKQKLEDCFNIPVIVENEANAGAYGENKFGIGQNLVNLIYVSSGIGIGAGIILNGDLYKGINGYSGEFGHMTIDFNGIECSCGNKGCWELYASEQSLLNLAQKLDLGDKGNLTLDDLITLAEEGNTSVIELFNIIGHNLGVGIINIIHAFNPQKIIVGNRLVHARQWMEDSILKVIKQHTLTFHQSDVEISFSDLSIPVTALGVAAFSIENFIDAKLQE
ncbi:MAG: ROK family transcriptional regulator [Bacillota bacterium]|nr:ROK family transcriptional regulator [Bacillota bacterium]